VVCHVSEARVVYDLIVTTSDDLISSSWRSIPCDLTDEEWELIADLVPSFSGDGQIGRPTKWSKRKIVDAILYVAATGCQWRALPPHYPHWNTVHRYHVTWSRDGTWETLCGRLRDLVREAEGRDPGPSGGIVDARSVPGASTVTGPTRGFDAGKKVSGRKVFGLVDTLGLLLAVSVVAASVTDNLGGIGVVDEASLKSDRLSILWVDGGFKQTFIDHCDDTHDIDVEVVNRIQGTGFQVLARRWVVERTWAWLVNHRRLRIDYERDPNVTKGFVWAAHTRLLLRRLTTPPPT
jgi:transposase